LLTLVAPLRDLSRINRLPRTPGQTAAVILIGTLLVGFAEELVSLGILVVGARQAG